MRQGNPGRKSKLTRAHVELIHDLLQADAGRTREEIEGREHGDFSRKDA